VKLCRFVTSDASEEIGIVQGDRVTPIVVDSATGRLDDQLLMAAISRGERITDTKRDLPINEVSLRSPLVQPPSIRDFFAFEEHVKRAAEPTGRGVDEMWYDAPVFYFGNPASVYGPGDEIPAPATRALDYELEVACVIGSAVHDLSATDPEEAIRALAGFVIMNDWSARDLQAREMRVGLGPAKGKDFATSLGPWIVTPDELADLETGRPRGRMTARVNGELWSQGNMGDIYFSWFDILARASSDTRLVPGDVIGSGTCGTGCIVELRISHGKERYPWLKPGDVVELEVEGIGMLRNQIAARQNAD
jgi:fumarylacetoacetate (FAA) hydrolase